MSPFSDFVRRAGGQVNTNTFVRKPTLLADQPVIRMNRDTLYGSAVIDTAGGATITVPCLRTAAILSLSSRSTIIYRGRIPNIFRT